MTTIFTPYGGIFNDIRQMMGKEAIFVMGEKNAFLPLVIFSDLWKNVGWGSIVYLAPSPVWIRNCMKRHPLTAQAAEMYLAYHDPGNFRHHRHYVHYGSRRYVKRRL